MKKILVIVLLAISITAASVIKDVNNYNVLDEPVEYAVIFQYDSVQNIVFCDLYSADSTQLATDRYFYLDEAPFELTEEEIESLE